MKLPKLYILIIAILILLGIFVGATWSGLLSRTDLEYLYTLLSTFLIGWFVIILLAIIGAVFLGMYLSHRILLAKDFTPFEKSMLEMREDISELKKKLDAIDQKLKP